MAETVISKNIRTRRLALGMTQEELASKVFATRQSISNYETGKSKPDYETIRKIAEALEVSPEVLIYDAGRHSKKVKAWVGLAIIIFCFIQARFLCFSGLPIKMPMPQFVAYLQGYTTIIVPTVSILLGWILVRLYELYIQKNKLFFKHSRLVSTIIAIIFCLWFLSAFSELIKIYTAAKDPIINDYGGPRMLGVYIETFYYKYIFSPMSQTPIIYLIFIFLGGFAAACKQKANT